MGSEDLGDYIHRMLSEQVQSNTEKSSKVSECECPR